MSASSRNIAVTGAGGLLGTAVLRHFAGRHTVHAAGRAAGLTLPGTIWTAFDLLDRDQLAGWLRAARPAAVVHCAALVNVDACEKNVAAARALHAGTTAAIAEIIAPWRGRLVYISTDSVFDGRKASPYAETDPVNPPNAYARTKLEGEDAALAAEGTVLRTNIFGWSRAERLSFAEWVLKGLVEGSPLTMFRDVQYTPIHVSHLAAIIEEAVARDLTGLFHATGSTVLSKHEFAVRLAAAFGLSAGHLRAISVDDAGLGAARPKNMALASGLLQAALGRPTPSVDDGIAAMKREYDDGDLAKIKSRGVKSGYRFWETV